MAGGFSWPRPSDGTRTCLWRVRRVDFDQPKGTIVNQVGRLDYRIV
jgi:hypothetical protein